MHRPLLVSCLGGLLLCLRAVPQQQPPAQQAGQQPEQAEHIFRSDVKEVILPVTVTDKRGRYVSNLEVKDFRVLADGKPQQIRFFNHTEKQPVVVGFLVDMSSGTRIHWKTFQEAILELVWDLLPGGPRYSGYLITYSDTADLLVNTSSDSEKIAAKIRVLKPTSGGAALFDAIERACTDRRLVPGEPFEPRRVIVVIGNGHDSTSKLTQAQALELAQRNMVTIYAISTENFGFDNPDKDVLEKLATETGGRVEYPLSNLYKDVSGYLSHPSDDGNYALTVGSGGYAAEISNGIVKAVRAIDGDITTQYVLTFNADSADNPKTKGYHKIVVDIPELPNVSLNYRPGYYSDNPKPRAAGVQK